MASSLFTSLVAYYPFDANSVEATGAGPNGADTLVSYANGAVQQAAETIADGGSVVDLGAGIALGSAFTVDVWVRPRANAVRQSAWSAFGQLYGVDANNGLFLHDTGAVQTLELFVGGVLRIASAAITPGVGYWVTLTYDGTTARLYINNVAAGSWTGSVSWTLKSCLAVDTALTSTLAAQIDELGIWSRVLTADERTTRYNAGLGLAYPFGPVPALPPAVAQPSTYQQALQGTPTPILWADFQEETAPPWLRAGSGKGWLRGVGDLKDALEDGLRDSVKARFPELTPLDGLGPLGAERQLDQGVAESVEDYRARLKASWEVWPWAGTPTGLLRALWYAGYTNVYLLTGNGKAHVLDVDLNVVTTDATGTVLPSGFWNAFRVVFPAPLKASWVPTPPTNDSDEVNTIRRIVKKWKAGHALFEDIVVYDSGLMWGFPPTQQWGGGGLLWGGTTVTWTPD